MVSTGLDAGRGEGRRALGSNPGKDQVFLSSPKRPELLWGPTIFLFNGFRGSFSGQSGRGVKLTTEPN